MTTLVTLWLPILLSAVFVFIVSSVIHMVVQWHKADCKLMPDEAKVLAGLRSANLSPGTYVFPGCKEMKDLGSPEMRAKFQQGPVGSIVVRPAGMPSMGKSLGQWFLWCLLVSAIVAWLTLQARPPGVPTGEVFKMAFGAAMLGHAFTYVVDTIWKGVSWSTTARFFVDGVLYALTTAATFAWLWPATF